MPGVDSWEWINARSLSSAELEFARNREVFAIQMPAIVASLTLFIVLLVSLSASRNAYLANDLQ